MSFEYDPVKSLTNKDKHGIDFEEAQKIWESDFVEIPAKTTGEPRWLIIGKIDDLVWTAVITYRNNMIRIISVRRSRDDEATLYQRIR